MTGSGRAAKGFGRLYESHGDKIRYLVVGVWNTLFGVLLFNAFLLAFGSERYMVWFWVCWVIAVVQSTVAMKYLVFRSRGGLVRQILRAYLVYLPAQGLSAVVLWGAVQLLHLSVPLGQLLTIFVTTIFSYVGHKYFTFRVPLEVGEVPPAELIEGEPGS